MDTQPYTDSQNYKSQSRIINWYKSKEKLNIIIHLPIIKSRKRDFNVILVQVLIILLKARLKNIKLKTIAHFVKTQLKQQGVWTNQFFFHEFYF